MIGLCKKHFSLYFLFLMLFVKHALDAFIHGSMRYIRLKRSHRLQMAHICPV